MAYMATILIWDSNKTQGKGRALALLLLLSRSEKRVAIRYMNTTKDPVVQPTNCWRSTFMFSKIRWKEAATHSWPSFPLQNFTCPEHILSAWQSFILPFTLCVDNYSQHTIYLKAWNYPTYNVWPCIQAEFKNPKKTNIRTQNDNKTNTFCWVFIITLDVIHGNFWVFCLANVSCFTSTMIMWEGTNAEHIKRKAWNRERHSRITLCNSCSLEVP